VDHKRAAQQKTVSGEIARRDRPDQQPRAADNLGEQGDELRF
jgi:hypothetical protein